MWCRNEDDRHDSSETCFWNDTARRIFVKLPGYGREAHRRRREEYGERRTTEGGGGGERRREENGVGKRTERGGGLESGGRGRKKVSQS